MSELALRSRIVDVGLEIYVVVVAVVSLSLCSIGVDDLVLGVLDDGFAVRTGHCTCWDHYLALTTLLAHHNSLLIGTTRTCLDSLGIHQL